MRLEDYRSHFRTEKMWLRCAYMGHGWRSSWIHLNLVLDHEVHKMVFLTSYNDPFMRLDFKIVISNPEYSF